MEGLEIMRTLIATFLIFGSLLIGTHILAERIAGAMDDSANRIAEAGRTGRG
jgi:hypothetical protein